MLIIALIIFAVLSVAFALRGAYLATREDERFRDAYSRMFGKED